MSSGTVIAGPTAWGSAAMQAHIRRRYRRERLFLVSGAAALALVAGFLLFMLATIVATGWNSFRATELQVMMSFDAARLGVDAAAAKADPALLAGANFQGLVADSVERSIGPDAGDGMRPVSDGAWLRVRDMVKADPSLIGTTQKVWLLASSPMDQLAKGALDLDLAEANRPVTDAEIAMWRKLEGEGRLRTGPNPLFLTGSDSVDPELAGIWGALKGSLMMLAITFAISFPLGTLSAIHLEEFAARSRLAGLIEASISNLAAVPSIIFGLLGLAVFLNLLNMPRSAPVVGGLTLALMTFPVIVIASRAAIRAVPASIRAAALGIGGSPVQVVLHHVLPLALPGIVTGTLFGMARALGEAAPLLLIGMLAFLTSPPQGLTQPATALPVQLFLWSDMVSRGFLEKTAGAIMVLLALLILLNGLALWVRNRFEARL